MKDKDLKQLAIIIQKQGISQKTGELLLKRLTKRHLKTLIRYLRLEQTKNSVTVTGTVKPTAFFLAEIKKMFPYREVKTQENSKIGAGLVICDNDTIYDMSFKGMLDGTVSALNESL